MPNFVAIARTAAEICEFQYYASLACLKMPIHAPFWGFWGVFKYGGVNISNLSSL